MDRHLAQNLDGAPSTVDGYNQYVFIATVGKGSICMDSTQRTESAIIQDWTGCAVYSPVTCVVVATRAFHEYFRFILPGS